MAEPQERRKETEARLVARAWSDPGFKQLLLTNPKEAIQQETGIVLPEAYQVSVVEETPTTGVLVLPLNLTELSEEQLEAVAGGHSFCHTT